MVEKIIKELNGDLDLILGIQNKEEENDNISKNEEILKKKFFFKKLYCEYFIIILTKIYTFDFGDDNNEELYLLIDKILNILFNQSDDIKHEKVSTIFYCFCIIQNKLRKFIPEFLINNLINYFSKIDNDNLLIKGLLILINENNLSPECIPKIFPLIKQNSNIFKFVNLEIIEYFLYESILIYIKNQISKLSKLIQFFFNYYNNEETICNYILFFQNFAINNKNPELYYKLIKILLKSKCSLTFNIIRNEMSEKIINRFFTIILLNENNELIISITLIALNELFLKQYIIGFGQRILQEKDTEFSFIQEFFNFMNNIKMTPLILKSYLFCIFKNENIFNELKFVIKGVNKFNFQFECLHQNIDIISNIFNNLEKIYNNEELFSIYKNFLYEFYNQAFLLCKNNYSNKQDDFKFSIYSSYKILGNIFESFIIYSMKNEKFNFKITELCDIIDKCFLYFKKPFYYQLILNLFKKLLNLIEENEINILTEHINSLLNFILNKIKRDKIKDLDNIFTLNYYLNIKNTIYLFIEILELIIYKNNKTVGEMMIDKFLNFINENKDYFLYIRDIFQDNKSIIERILDILIAYYTQFDKGYENVEIINKYYYQDNICIFSILDFKKNQNSNKMKEISKIEKLLEKENEVTKNFYFLSFKVINKLLSIDLSSIKNKAFSNLLENMISDIIKEININKINIIKNKLIGDNIEYNNLKEKIIQRITSNNDIDIDFLKMNLINEKVFIKENKDNENYFFINNNFKSLLKEDKKDYSDILKKMKISNLNIEFWYDDIKNFGLLSVHKTKSFLLKRLFSLMYLDKYFINNSLDKLEKKFCEKTNNLLFIKRYHEPKKIKNYITKNYTKPFLKLFTNFYKKDTYEITHSYAIEFKEENNKKKKIIPLYYNESKNKIYCELIIIEGSIFCSVLIFKGFLIIKSEKEIKIKPRTPNNMFSSVKYINKDKFIIIPFEYINEIITRRFLYIWQACEIFTKDNKSYLLNFLNKENLLHFQKTLKKQKGKNDLNIIKNSVDKFKSLNILQKWRNNEISNFDFLNLLNKYSSRSYNDLNQYPIFPWIFDSYDNLTEKNNKLRDFKYPISAQSLEKRNFLIEKYEALTNTTDYIFHNQIHYSTSAFVYFYLLRLSPITESHINFQGKKFDNPDRMFHLFSNTKNLLEKYNDNRELIPEIFYFDELFYNINLNFFGIKSKNIFVHNIFLPQGCLNSSHFIYIQRMSLESNDLKNSIRKWINNIFGYNQYNEKKLKKSCNIFNWESYENIFKKKYSKGEISEESLNDELTFINSLGQCPAVLFDKKIEKTNFNNIEEKIMNKDNLINKIESCIDGNESISFYCPIQLKNYDKSEILILKYSKDRIIILDNKYSIKTYKKETIEFIQNYNIKNTYSNLTQNCFIEYDNLNLIINSNYYDEIIEVFNEKKIIQINLHCVISCLCKINNDFFYAGTVEGIILKYKFHKSENDVSVVKIGNEYICHNNKMIWKIIFNENLNTIISVGADNFIFIRNCFSFELINVIKLEGNDIYNIYLNEFNNIYSVNTIKNTIDVYTLNGLKICDMKNNIKDNNLCFPYNNKLFYFNDNNKVLSEICPISFDKELIEVPVIFKDLYKSKIEFLKFDEDEKCFDFWTEDKIIIRLYLLDEKLKNKKMIESLNKESNKKEKNWYNLSFLWDF